MNTFTKLEALKAEKKEVLAVLQNMPFRDKKGSAEFERLQELNISIAEYSKQVEDENLKNNLDKINSFKIEINALIEKIKTYKGDFVKADGTSTKKFKDFCKALDTKIYVYAKRRSVHSSTEIIFVGDHNGLKKEIFEYNLTDFKGYKETTFEEVKLARAKHNELLKEIERLQTELNKNYQTATANYDLHHHGQSYTF